MTERSRKTIGCGTDDWHAPGMAVIVWPSQSRWPITASPPSGVFRGLWQTAGESSTVGTLQDKGFFMGW